MSLRKSEGTPTKEYERAWTWIQQNLNPSEYDTLDQWLDALYIRFPIKFIDSQQDFFNDKWQIEKEIETVGKTEELNTKDFIRSAFTIRHQFTAQQLADISGRNINTVRAAIRELADDKEIRRIGKIGRRKLYGA